MKFLTIEELRTYLHVDGEDRDAEITMLANSAETEALGYMQRSYDSLIVEFGEVPADIKLACLAHAASAFKTREDESDRKRGMSSTKHPYAWEAKLTRYIPTDRI